MPDDLLANEIRYAGLRSVSFTRLDKNRIAYAHLDKAVQVEEISKEWFEMLDQHPDDFVEWAQELSCQNGVSHWLVDKTSEPAMSFTSISGTAVFDNDSFSIIKLNPCSQ